MRNAMETSVLASSTLADQIPLAIDITSSLIHPLLLMLEDDDTLLTMSSKASRASPSSHLRRDAT
jgi:hypothetical protein